MGTKKNPLEWKDFTTALITGASSGLGKDYAEFFASKKINLIIVARRKEKLEEIKKELESKYSIEVEINIKDLSNEEDIKTLSESISQRNDVDILINNAGFGLEGDLQDINVQKAADMIKVHNIAPMYLTHAILPTLLEKDRGIIINVASMISYVPCRNGMYASTKAFLTLFSRSIELDVRKTNIRIQALCPGFFHSEFHDNDYADLKEGLPKFFFKPSLEVMNSSIKGLEKNKTIVIPGLLNKLTVYFAKSNWIGKFASRKMYEMELK